jgi:hypothetical protein
MVKVNVEITPAAGQGRLWFAIEAGAGEGVQTYKQLGAWIGERCAKQLEILSSKIAADSVEQSASLSAPAPAAKPALPATVSEQTERARPTTAVVEPKRRRS